MFYFQWWNVMNLKWEREGIKRILAIRYVYIYSYKTGWSTCANLLKHFKEYIWFHQILLKQNKLHLKIKLKLFFIFFQKREASQEKVLKDPIWSTLKLLHWTDLFALSVNGCLWATTHTRLFWQCITEFIVNWWKD